MPTIHKLFTTILFWQAQYFPCSAYFAINQPMAYKLWIDNIPGTRHEFRLFSMALKHTAVY